MINSLPWLTWYLSCHRSISYNPTGELDHQEELTHFTNQVGIAQNKIELTLTKARHWLLMSPCCNQGALTLQLPDQTPVPFCMMWNDLGLYHVLCNHSHFLCRREPLVRRLCCHSKNCRAAGETPPGNRREGAQWYTPHFDDHWNLYMEHTLSQHSSFYDVTSY